jgi:hypothetical protein
MICVQLLLHCHEGHPFDATQLPPWQEKPSGQNPVVFVDEHPATQVPLLHT